MSSKRMRFGFLILAVYAALGAIGVYSESTTMTVAGIGSTDLAAIAASVDSAGASAGGASAASVEWHSFLPGAFK